MGSQPPLPQKTPIFLATTKRPGNVHVVLKYIHVMLQYRLMKTYHDYHRSEEINILALRNQYMAT